MHTPERRAETAYLANFTISRGNHLAWQCFAPDEFGRTRKHRAWTSKYIPTCPQNSAAPFPGSYQPLIPFQAIKESHFSCAVHQKMHLSRDSQLDFLRKIKRKRNFTVVHCHFCLLLIFEQGQRDTRSTFSTKSINFVSSFDYHRLFLALHFFIHTLKIPK